MELRFHLEARAEALVHEGLVLTVVGTVLGMVLSLAAAKVDPLIALRSD